jgi:hypothetical protein
MTSLFLRLKLFDFLENAKYIVFFDGGNTWVHPTYDARNAMVLNASNNVAIPCQRVSYNPMASCND